MAPPNAKLAPPNLTIADLKPTLTPVTEEPREFGPNEDVKALIYQAYKYSQLPVAEREKNSWAAGIVVGRLIDLAKPEDVQKARDEITERWSAQLKAKACLPTDSAFECAKKVIGIIFDPWWWLRSDDGKPPAIRIVAESALTNPNRTLAQILAGFEAVKPEDRPALADAVRAFLSRAWEGALGPARIEYVDLMRSRPEFNWPKDPWAAVLPYDGNDPPAKILVANQGKTKDGGLFDDPTDDTAWEKLKFWASDSVRTWDPSILVDYNPVYQFGSWANETAGDLWETGKGLVKDTAKAVYGDIIVPLALTAGVVVIGIAAYIFLSRKKK